LILAFAGNTGKYLVLIVAACNTSLLVIPIGRHGDLPWLEKASAIPVFGSAIYVGLLLFAISLQLGETFEMDLASPAGATLFASAGVLLLLWLVVFELVVRAGDRLVQNDRRCTWLLVGSGCEILAAGVLFFAGRSYGRAQNALEGLVLALVVITAALGPRLVSLYFHRPQRMAGMRQVA
jgi:hypothetical protein